jgi:hypothetical protein
MFVGVGVVCCCHLVCQLRCYLIDFKISDSADCGLSMPILLLLL